MQISFQSVHLGQIAFLVETTRMNLYRFLQISIHFSLQYFGEDRFLALHSDQIKLLKGNEHFIVFVGIGILDQDRFFRLAVIPAG